MEGLHLQAGSNRMMQWVGGQLSPVEPRFNRLYRKAASVHSAELY